jgi:hypothetical protein
MGIMDITFRLNEKQFEKYQAFIEQQDAKAIEIQKAKIQPSDPFYDIFVQSWAMDYPYYGAIGGAYEWRICSTSLGNVIYIKNTYTGEELNLTDYSDW